MSLRGKLRGNRRSVPLWIEWNEGDASTALAALLVRNGARGVEVDNDVDLEAFPSPVLQRAHSVLRVRLGKDYPLWQLLADVASFPGVFSVGEL